MLALDHNWTPVQVDALDPEFVDELIAAKTAHSDHQLFSTDAKNDKALKRQQDQRRLEIMRWRRGE